MARIKESAGLLSSQHWRAALLAGASEGDAIERFGLGMDRRLAGGAGEIELRRAGFQRQACCGPRVARWIKGAFRFQALEDGLVRVDRGITGHLRHAATVLAALPAAGRQLCFIAHRECRSNQRKADQHRENYGEEAPHLLPIVLRSARVTERGVCKSFRPNTLRRAKHSVSGARSRDARKLYVMAPTCPPRLVLLNRAV